MPGHHIVDINNKCNSYCIFCAFQPGYREQDTQDYKVLVKELIKARKKTDSLIITGGEPTIHPMLFDFIKRAKKLRYKDILIATNGFMLYYPDFARKLASYNLRFQISFQTTDPIDYYKITRIKNAHKYVTTGLENLRRLGSEIAINTVIHKLNYKKLPDIVTYLLPFANNIQLAFINPIGTSVFFNKTTVPLKMTTAWPYLEPCLKHKKVKIENIPICLAEQYINSISDLSKPEENRDYYEQGKMKMKKCSSCKYDNICWGVWEAYVELFGEDEFKAK